MNTIRTKKIICPCCEKMEYNSVDEIDICEIVGDDYEAICNYCVGTFQMKYGQITDIAL